MRFTYYPGCSLESTAIEYNQSAIQVCRALGIELLELEDWNCCGATSAHSAVGLAAAIVAPEDNTKLSRFFKVPLNQEGFFLEAHLKLRPVDFGTDGVFMCGLAHGPKSLEENIAQAKAAAGRAGSVLSKDSVETQGKTAIVNKWKCTMCGTCEAVCPSKAIVIDQNEKAAVVYEACARVVAPALPLAGAVLWMSRVSQTNKSWP